MHLNKIVMGETLNTFSLPVCKLTCLMTAMLASAAVCVAAEYNTVPANSATTLQYNDANQAAWTAITYLGNPSDYEFDVHFYDGNTLNQISENMIGNPSVALNNKGQVAWSDGHQVYLYENGSNVQISGPLNSVTNLHINEQGNIAWQGDYDVYLYRNSVVENITNTPGTFEIFHDLNDNNEMVYDKYAEANGTYSRNFMYFDGLNSVQITNNSSIKDNAQLNNDGQMVWYDYDSNKIYMYEAGQTKEITTSAVPQGLKQAGKYIVWGQNDSTGLHVYYYNDGDGSIKKLSDSSPVNVNFWMDINEQGHVVWSPRIGSTNDAYNFGLDFTYYNGSVNTDITPHFETPVLIARLNNNDQVAYQGFQSLYIPEAEAQSQPVPEPSTLLLLGAGIPGIAWLRRRRKT